MSERAAMRRAVGTSGPGPDAFALAEAIWLAAHQMPTTGSGPGPGILRSGEPEGPGTAPPQPPATSAASDEEQHTSPDDATTFGDVTGAATRIVGVRPVRALPQSMELARSLRPFQRPWPRGRRAQLDLHATVDQYAMTGLLIPIVMPAPERWFDAVVVADNSPGMVVWDNALKDFLRVLHQVGAFRQIRLLRLDPVAGAVVSDGSGRPQDTGRLLRAPDSRRLVIVWSDFAARAWQHGLPWSTIHVWAEKSPTIAIDPLPAALWAHAGLDLPAVRVHAPVPGAANTALRYTLSPLLRLLASTDENWLPVPLASLTPSSLGRLASALIRTDPAGCEAVLTTAVGRIDEDPDETAPDGEALATAFLRLASPAAGRLATLTATWEQLPVGMLSWLSVHALPKGDPASAGEVIGGGLYDVALHDRTPVLRFRRGVRERLLRGLRIDDIRQLNDLIAEQSASMPGALRTLVANPDGDNMHALESVAFASASREALRALGVEPAMPTETPDIEEQSVSAAVHVPLMDLFRDAVQSACDDLHNLEADDAFALFVRWADGGAWVEEVMPDLSTIEWSPSETFDGDTEIGLVHVEATVSFVALVPKSDVDYQDVRILEVDWNDHYSRVLFDPGDPCRLSWSYRREPARRPELEFNRVDEVDGDVRLADLEMQNLTAALLRLDPDGARLALILRRTFDYLYDGARTGRFAWRQLLKEEKHALGKRAETELAQEFDLAYGERHDFRLAGVEFEFVVTTQRLFMVSRHRHPAIHMFVTADDERGVMSVAVVRATSDLLASRPNRDQKQTLSASGRAAMQWIHRNVPIPANLLSRLPAEVVDAVMSPPSGAARVRELLRRVRGTPIDMVAIDTVCQQRDATRRVREAGTLLRAEGILVLSGSTAVGRRIAEELHYHLPKQHFMSIRVTYSSPANPAPSFEAAGRRWTVGLAGSRLVKAPDINAVV
ncbi:hypothetical protein JCM9534A_17060 [Catenuloplanes indicus JCM 9534]